jgi:two-component system, response regulator PdtaR
MGERGLVLVVGGEPLAAIDMAFQMSDAGFRVLGPALSLDEALALIARQPPVAGIIDGDLGCEVVTPLAERLRAQGTPFVLLSARYWAALFRLPLLRRSPLLPKPLSPADLVATLETIVPEPGRRLS